MKTASRRRGILVLLTLGIGLAIAGAVQQPATLLNSTGISAPAINTNQYLNLMASSCNDLNALAQLFEEEQYTYLPLLPPDPNFVLTAHGSLTPFNFSNLPEGFNLQLLIPEQAHGVAVYTLQIALDPASRETVFMNSQGAVLYKLPPAAGYDPYAWLKARWPNLIPSNLPAANTNEWLQMHDPAHVQLSLKLIALDDVVPYLQAEAQAQQDAMLEAALHMPMTVGRMMNTMTYTAPDTLTILDISMDTNGANLTVGYPDSLASYHHFILACSDLLATNWVVLGNDLDVTGMNPYYWTDTTVTNADLRFYRAMAVDPLADSNSDGVPDWWKILLGYSATTSASTTATNGLTLQQNYLSLLTIPNAWAVYTATNQVQITADIRSTNSLVTIRAAEYFLDDTNGAALALSATNGTFNTTSVTAVAMFTPTFPAGERHEAYIHAQGNNRQWCPFKTVIINPNVNDILDQIQTNYSAIQDLQFNLSFTETKNNVVTLKDTVVVKMKGPYKIRKEYANGLQFIQNENTEWWHMPSVGGGAMQTGLNGNFAPTANRDCDFFWDVALWRSRMTCSLTNTAESGIQAIALTPATGSVWQAQSAQVDIGRGFVTQLSESDANISVVMDYLNPMEVATGVWMFTGHRHTIQFASGDQIVHESILSSVIVNQGLDDSLFAIPTE